MAKLEIYDSGWKTEDFDTIKRFLARDGIEIGTFPLNQMAKELAKKQTLSDEERKALLNSYENVASIYKQLPGFRQDVVCLYPEFEHFDAIMQKFGNVHFHYENEYWYFIDGFFGFVFFNKLGIKYRVTIYAGEYVQVPERKWQCFHGTKQQKMKSMRFFTTTNTVQPLEETIHSYIN